MSRTKAQAFPIIIQCDEHGQYYVQKTFSDNVAMEEWLQNFTNQRLQINNLKRDLQRANETISNLPKQIVEDIKKQLSTDFSVVENHCAIIGILDTILKQYEEKSNGTVNS